MHAEDLFVPFRPYEGLDAGARGAFVCVLPPMSNLSCAFNVLCASDFVCTQSAVELRQPRSALFSTMGSERRIDETSHQASGFGRNRLLGGGPASGKAFQGANVDTQKANNAPPKSKSGSPNTNKSPIPTPRSNSNYEAPPDSVGWVFPSFPRVADDLVSTVRTLPARPDHRPLGVKNKNGGNLCYRNAVLTMLINCDPLMAYASWHLANEAAPAADSGKLTGVSLLKYLVSLWQVRDAPADQQDGVSMLLNLRVAKFWLDVGYPLKSPAKWEMRLLPPSGTWGTFSGSLNHTQQDAAEFMGWVLGTIDHQLVRYRDNKDDPSNRTMTVAQRNLMWLLGSSTISRVDCPKCRWRVRRRTELVSNHYLTFRAPHVASSREITSLEDCISRIFCSKLDEDWECSRCENRGTGGYQFFSLQKTPDVLLIVLGRNTGRLRTVRNRRSKPVLDENGRRQHHYVGKKNLAAVTIPEELDVSRWLDQHEFGPGSKVKYRLTGMVSHQGKSMHAGHDNSFVLAGQHRDKWYRLDDADVSPLTSLSSFDDSGASQLARRDFEYRFTPYLMLYEKTFAEEIVNPPQEVRNVNEGHDADIRPSHWTGTDPIEVSTDPPLLSPRPGSSSSISTLTNLSSRLFEHPSDDASTDSEDTGKDDFTVPGPAADEGGPKAAVGVSINIDDEVEIDFPLFSIEQFDRSKERKLKIKAKLFTPKTDADQAIASEEDEVVYVDLMDAWFEAELERRERALERKRLVKKAKAEGKDEKKVQAATERGLRLWDRKRKRTSWASRWKAESDSEDTEAEPEPTPKRRKMPGRKAKNKK